MRALFDAARRVPSDRRAELLDRCEDAALRAEVESLLASHAEAGAFLAEPALGGGFDVSRVGEMPASIRHFRILERLGTGGYGDVYRAEQERPIRRTVALKVIKPGMDTRAVVARFERERGVLSVLTHPHIAVVLEAGETETGHPYFAMEYVPGLPITTHCEVEQLTLAQRLELFLQVCEAVEHAHRRGYLHRDLKPGNILVAKSEDGRRADAKVIDFGVAKALFDTEPELTRRGEVLGTLEYMSPEQAEGSHDLDTRTDVYALGVVMYELLTGTQPFQRSSESQLRQAIAEAEPLRPSSGVPAGRSRELRGDLDWIVLKCLAKNREDRYASVSHLAEDVARHLRHVPVKAGPPSLRNQIAKLYRRHRLLLATSAAIGVALLVALVFGARAYLQTERAVAASARAADLGRLIQKVFGDADPFWGDQNRFMGEVLSRLSSLAPDVLTNEPADIAMLHMMSGRSYLDRGALEAAEPYLVKAIDVCARSLPAMDRTRLRAIHEMGVLRLFQQQAGEAEQKLNEALAGRRATFGPEDEDTLASQLELGYVIARDRPAEAEWTFRQVLEDRSRALGPEHEQTLEAVDALASLYAEEGRWSTAESIRQYILGVRRRSGKVDLALFDALRRLADVYRGEHQDDRAEAIYRDVLERGTEVLWHLSQENHRDKLATIEALGDLCFEQGRSEEALRFYLEAVSRRKTAVGPWHPNTIQDLERISGWYAKEGRRNQSEAILRDTRRGLDNDLGAPERGRRAMKDWEAQHQGRGVERLSSLVPGLGRGPGPVGPHAFDLAADFSPTRNPSGPWSYNCGACLLPAVAGWSGNPGQSAWARSPAERPDMTPTVFSPTSDFGDARSGDVLIHSAHDTADANVAWTSPAAGVIDVAGSVWTPSPQERSNVWRLLLEDRVLTGGSATAARPYDRVHPFDLAWGTGGRHALTGLAVKAGDVLRFTVARTSASDAGTTIGLDLRVALSVSGPEALVFDLRRDWTMIDQSHCPWSIASDDVPLPQQEYWLDTRQSAFARSAVEPVPSVFQRTVHEAEDLAAGDVAVVVGAAPDEDAQITWTSPVAGLARIRGHVWPAKATRGAAAWRLSRNGKPLSSGELFDGAPYSRTQPLAFESGSGGCGALEDVVVAPGDRIRLDLWQAHSTGGPSPTCGVDLRIYVTSAGP